MGSSGHLSHIIEDWDLTFDDLKDVISSAADARLESVTEKTDGTEMVFTWNELESRIGAARNGSDIRGGGMSAADLAKRFAGRGGLETALTSAFDALTRAASALPRDARLRLFGPSGEKWYSIEIMHSAWPRTVRYAGDNIVFHERPVFTLDRASGKIDKDNGTAGREVSKWIDTLRSGTSGTSWKLHPRAAVELQKLTDGSITARALVAVDAEMSEHGLADGDTIGEYVRRRLARAVGTELRNDSATTMVVARLMHDKGAPNVTAIAKAAGAQAGAARDLVQREKELIEAAIEPLERAVREFASGVLKGVRSLFVSDHDGETQRLRDAVTQAIGALEGASGKTAKAMLATQAAKIGRLEDLSPIEGIVFMYNGKPYKLTGMFAPVNRVLSFVAFNDLSECSRPARLVSEGGHSFDSVGPVTLADLRDAWPKIERTLRDAGVTSIEPIGTTWKKDPMGDVDVAVDHPGGRDELHSALVRALGAGSVKKVGPNIVSAAFATASGAVQVDAMVGDISYLKWSRYGPSPDANHPEHSAVKGVVRNILLNAIAAHASGRVFSRPGSRSTLDRERYVVDFDRGLYRVIQTKRSARGGTLADWKTVERELVSSEPDEIVGILLGGRRRASSLRRFEDVVAALVGSREFSDDDVREIRDDLLAKLREHVKSGRDIGLDIDRAEELVTREFGRAR